jgi:hypothetical protein
MTHPKTAKDEARKGATDEPSETQEVGSRLVVLKPAGEPKKERAPKGNIEARVLPWRGPKQDERAPSIGSMQPPGK